MIDDNLIYGFQDEFRWLSNFCNVPQGVYLEGEKYLTVEHAYQAAKTTDLPSRYIIRMARTPGIAKRLGKELTIRGDWEDVKLDYMRKFIKQKFSFHSILGNMLQGTGSAEIVEANTWGDTFWGKCNGKGKNYLGKIIMQRRDELNQQEKNEQ